MSRAPWADFVMAEIFDGVAELPDPGENPRILRYFEEGCPGFEPTKGDETDWCAAFIWYALLTTNAVIPSQRMPIARSLLSVGTAVYLPRPGDLAVLWRGSRDSWMGHVGVFLGRFSDDSIYLAGGNQGNRASVGLFSETRLIGYRRPHLIGEET